MGLLCLQLGGFIGHIPPGRPTKGIVTWLLRYALQIKAEFKAGPAAGTAVKRGTGRALQNGPSGSEDWCKSVCFAEYRMNVTYTALVRNCVNFPGT